MSRSTRRRDLQVCTLQYIGCICNSHLGLDFVAKSLELLHVSRRGGPVDAEALGFVGLGDLVL